jgi:hypothetical protein
MADRRLKDRSRVPRHGWKALQEDGETVKGLSFKALLNAVEQYRVANGLPVPANIRRLVEEQLCRSMEKNGEGEECGRCAFLNENDLTNPPELREWRHGPRSLVNFGKAVAVVVGEMATGKPVCVSREEAERRAGVCAQCPYNINIGNCWGCGELGRIFRSVQGGLETSQDSRLESCDRCGCALKTKVWITDDALTKVEREQGIGVAEFPGWCWRGVREEAGETDTPGPGYCL